MAPDTGNRSSGVYLTVGVGAALAGALTYIALVDPHRPGSLFPPCPFKALTGWECPACGGLRMVHDVLHGDFAAAVVDNVFFLILIAVGLPLAAGWAFWQRRRNRSVFAWWQAVVLVVALVAWTVVRNLPGFPLVPTVLIG